MKTLLKGGTIVSTAGSRVADLLIDGETIVQIGEHLSADGATVVDVSGKLLFPGFIDAHTHFDLDVCNTTTADDFESGTRSAVCGGTTMVIDFACPNKGETLGYGLDLWHKKADGRSSCDYSFHNASDRIACEQVILPGFQNNYTSRCVSGDLTDTKLCSTKRNYRVCVNIVNLIPGFQSSSSQGAQRRFLYFFSS